MLFVREILDSDRLVNAEHHLGATGLNFRNRKNMLPITQVRILVGFQSWTIGPRLALLWRPRFGDHSWANCGGFGFTNFGSQHRQPKMCATVGSTMAQTRTDCRANFGELI